jgi:hypothetical protein
MIWIITTNKYCNYTEATEIRPMDQHPYISNNLLRYVLPASYTLWMFRPSVWCCHWVGSLPCWKDHTAFFYRVKQYVLQSFLNCMALQIKVLWSFQMTETTHPTAQHHIQHDMNLQQYFCNDLRFSSYPLFSHEIWWSHSTLSSNKCCHPNHTSYLQWPQHTTR